MAHDVFVSHSSADKPIADAVCAALEHNGIRVWIAPRDILAGQIWGEAIIDAIAGSKVMVVIFSSNSNSSSQVLREVERAVNKGVAIIPFRIENVAMSKSLEYFLSSPHWLDALTEPIERHIQNLNRIIQLLLNQQLPLDQAPAAQGQAGAKPGTQTSPGAQAAPDGAPLDSWYRRKRDTIWNRLLGMFDDK